MRDDRYPNEQRPQRTWGRIPVRAILPLCYLMAIAALLFVVYQLVVRLDPQEASAREAAALIAQERSERLQWVGDMMLVAWSLIPPLLVFGLGIVGILALYNRLARWQGVQADKVVDLAHAERPQLPTGLHTLTYHAPRTLPPAQRSLDDLPRERKPELTAAALVEPHTPTMATLIAQRRVGPGNPLILGYEQGAEVSGSWLDLYATITAGLPGTGKTTTQRFFAVQTALHGARFAIADPHAEVAEDSLAATLSPLRSAFLCEPASSPREVLDLVQYVAEIGDRRIRGLDRERFPIILWVDELTGLLGRSDVGGELTTLLEKIAQEYRKRHVYLSASGQIWTAARTTSELRDSFASVICHRMKRSQARLLLPTEEAAQVERLPAGSAVLWRTSGVTSTLQIPNTTAADVAMAAQLLGSNAQLQRLPAGFPQAASERAAIDLDSSLGSQPDASTNLASSALQSDKPVAAEAARAAALFLDGNDPAAIVQTLRGVKSADGGRRYQKALTEVLDLIRQGLAR